VLSLSNELVKYDPELNTIPLRKFSPVEMNLFFSIISRMRDKEDKLVRFSFSQLKELSNYKQTAGKVFIRDLERTYDHLMDLRFGRKSNGGLTIERFVMFTTFEIHGEAQEPYADIRIHPKAVPLLNNLERWVRYALVEFRNLNSGYAKTLFRLLKQYRTTGYAEFSKDDFTELLDIPKSYRESDINKKILTIAREELAPLFRGLQITKKYAKRRGCPVLAYVFRWTPEKGDSDDFSQGSYFDERRRLFNIEHNDDLSDKEKWRATDRIKKLPIGTTEELEKTKAAQKAQQIALDQQRRDFLDSMRPDRNGRA
jgi:plasmid replication initiation protein